MQSFESKQADFKDCSLSYRKPVQLFQQGRDMVSRLSLHSTRHAAEF